MKVMLRVVAYLLERKVGPYFSMAGEEYVVPPLHGLEDFRDFNVRYDKPIADLIHEAGGRLHIHCHGRLKAVLPAFLEIAPDVLHPVEAPPMGDVTAAEAKAMLQGRTCIEGNLQIAGLYEHTPARIREETEALIADAFSDRRNLIVSPTASPYIRGQGEVCFEQYRAMIETVLDWKA
jgi:hypothetical protein